MKEKLGSAVEALTQQLEEQIREVAETKKMINSLRKRMGEAPLYADIESESVVSGVIRPDQFYGKPLATAAQQYLEMRRQATSAEDILSGLNQGGFDFAALGWSEPTRLRSLAMSLAKNTKTFHRLPNGMFGLLAWYDKEVLRRAEKEKPAEPEKTGESVEQ